jgi:hypothetical protein
MGPLLLDLNSLPIASFIRCLLDKVNFEQLTPFITCSSCALLHLYGFMDFYIRT